MITNRKDGRKSCETMTHEEKAREICVEHFKYVVADPDGCSKELQKIIASALDSAEKKAWNEAIEAAVKVVEELSKVYDNEWNNKLGIAKHYIECGEEIASKIEALRKG